MKLDRLIGILAILAQRDWVTAPYLAERFEVSRRTINRDIEDLCNAGIPVVTRQGGNGGISIMENYKVDRTIFTRTEMQDILAGLRSLDSVNGTNRYGQLMEKLLTDSSDFMTGDQYVLIDLSSWCKDSMASKIEMVRNAIENGSELEFRYFSPGGGGGNRRIQPYYLIFRWSSWYVWGWCCLREDFRLFKLKRLEELRVNGRSFEKQVVPPPDLSNEAVFPALIQVKAILHGDCKWKLVEEFGVDCFDELEDGKLLFHGAYANKEHLIGWLLSFGDRVRLLEPEELRAELRTIVENMWKCQSVDECI